MEQKVNEAELDKLYSELYKVRNAGQKIHLLENFGNVTNIRRFLDSYENYLILKIAEIKKIISFSHN
ncbi:MAG: hypothetical protein ACM3P0_17210 [Acidobacteriota bacterium]